MTVGFGIIGFLDDYIKIVMKRSEGLNPIQKLIGQICYHRHFCTYYLLTQRGSWHRYADPVYRRI